MAMPPKDIHPKDLWSMIIEQEKPHRIVDFPRYDKEGKPFAQIAIVPLSQHEETIVQVEVEKSLRKYFKDANLEQPKNDSYKQIIQNIIEHASAVEFLFRACKMPDDLNKSFFPTKDHVSKYLTQSEIAVLLRQYLVTKESLSPVVSLMSESEMEAWIEALELGASYDPLERLSLVSAMNLILYMASQLLSLRKQNSLQSQQQENITEIL